MSDRILVDRDGEEIEIFDWVSVRQEHRVHSTGGYETFIGPILAGDGGLGEPDAITPRIAELIQSEFGVSERTLDERGIEVVDPDSNEVERL